MSDPESPDGPLREWAPAPVQEPLRNLPLLIALVLAGLEAVVLAAGAVWAVVTMVREGFDAAAVSIALAVVLLLFALLLMVGIYALWNGRRWGRGPVLTWQLIQAAIAIGAVQLAPTGAVIATLAISLAVGVGLLLPASVAATSRPSGSSDAVL